MHNLDIFQKRLYVLEYFLGSNLCTEIHIILFFVASNIFKKCDKILLIENKNNIVI